MTPKYEHVQILITNNIADLTLDRPEKLNALNAQLMDDIISACKWLDSQARIRVVVIKGGGKTFSAGADLTSFSSNDAEISWAKKRSNAMRGKILIDTISNMKAITIAEVHGYAIGGAFLMVLSCDFRIASDDAFFSIPEVDIGIPLAWGGIPRLVRELGPLKTKELVISCKKFTSSEAYRLGLLNDVVSNANLHNHCRNLADEISEKPYIAVQITKEHVNSVVDSMGDWGNKYGGADELMAPMNSEEFESISSAYIKKIKK